MTLFIDADYIVYKCCASCETEIDWGDDIITVTSRFSEACNHVQRELNGIVECLGGIDDVTLFFSSPNNFRKTIKPDYKGHRNRKKPCGYRRVINWLKEQYYCIEIDGLEADDALGIHATFYQGNVICSPDKDMRQIPGQLFDLSNEIVTITKEEGDRWHLIQTMAGDQTDGYPGIPGIGIKRAEALLEQNGATWETVLNAFLEKGLTEEDALENARLAKILQLNDYDFANSKPRLWTPTPCVGVEDGAGVQTQAN